MDALGSGSGAYILYVAMNVKLFEIFCSYRNEKLPQADLQNADERYTSTKNVCERIALYDNSFKAINVVLFSHWSSCIFY